ncbi:MAG: hypothetical protein IJ381_01560 [Clostridia bacterium]|nr:hypothetical protein [Clostridia bacterium]
MKKFLNNPWVVTVGSSVIFAGLTAVYDYAQKRKVFTTLWWLLSSAFKWVIKILNVELRFWWVLVFAAVIALGVYLISHSKGPELPKIPEFIEYTEEMYGGWKWEWDWEKNYEGKWDAVNLRAHCPKCDTPMRHNARETEFRCPRCGKHTFLNQRMISKDVRVVILDNVNRKYFKKG